MSKRLETIDAMIARGGKDPFLLYARAMELRSLGRLGEALDAFGRVEAEHPSYVPTYLMAAQTAQEAGDADRARAWAERGVARARAAGDGHALSELESFLGRFA
jgi:tetratricopeptide (TPR) repeat protein